MLSMSSEGTTETSSSPALSVSSQSLTSSAFESSQTADTSSSLPVASSTESLSHQSSSLSDELSTSSDYSSPSYLLRSLSAVTPFLTISFPTVTISLSNSPNISQTQPSYPVITQNFGSSRMADSSKVQDFPVPFVQIYPHYSDLEQLKRSSSPKSVSLAPQTESHINTSNLSPSELRQIKAALLSSASLASIVSATEDRMIPTKLSTFGQSQEMAESTVLKYSQENLSTLLSSSDISLLTLSDLRKLSSSSEGQPAIGKNEDLLYTSPEIDKNKDPLISPQKYKNVHLLCASSQTDKDLSTSSETDQNLVSTLTDESDLSKLSSQILTAEASLKAFKNFTQVEELLASSPSLIAISSALAEQALYEGTSHLTTQSSQLKDLSPLPPSHFGNFEPSEPVIPTSRKRRQALMSVPRMNKKHLQSTEPSSDIILSSTSSSPTSSATRSPSEPSSPSTSSLVSPSTSRHASELIPKPASASKSSFQDIVSTSSALSPPRYYSKLKEAQIKKFKEEFENFSKNSAFKVRKKNNYSTVPKLLLTTPVQCSPISSSISLISFSPKPSSPQSILSPRPSSTPPLTPKQSSTLLHVTPPLIRSYSNLNGDKFDEKIEEEFESFENSKVKIKHSYSVSPPASRKSLSELTLKLPLALSAPPSSVFRRHSLTSLHAAAPAAINSPSFEENKVDDKFKEHSYSASPSISPKPSSSSNSKISSTILPQSSIFSEESLLPQSLLSPKTSSVFLSESEPAVNSSSNSQKDEFGKKIKDRFDSFEQLPIKAKTKDTPSVRSSVSTKSFSKLPPSSIPKHSYTISQPSSRKSTQLTLKLPSVTPESLSPAASSISSSGFRRYSSTSLDARAPTAINSSDLEENKVDDKFKKKLENIENLTDRMKTDDSYSVSPSISPKPSSSSNSKISSTILPQSFLSPEEASQPQPLLSPKTSSLNSKISSTILPQSFLSPEEASQPQLLLSPKTSPVLLSETKPAINLSSNLQKYKFGKKIKARLCSFEKPPYKVNTEVSRVVRTSVPTKPFSKPSVSSIPRLSSPITKSLSSKQSLTSESPLPSSSSIAQSPATPSPSSSTLKENFSLKFIEQFESFSKFGDFSQKTCKISLRSSDRWMKQANIIDNINVSTTDSAIIFSKFSRNSKFLALDDYGQFLKHIAESKKMDYEEMKEKMISCGKPVIKNVTKPIHSDALDRLTDPSKYTGIFKMRYEQRGKGRHSGGKSRGQNVGNKSYVTGYKNEGTYDKNH